MLQQRKKELFLRLKRITAKINNLQFFAVFYAVRNVFNFYNKNS